MAFASSGSPFLALALMAFFYPFSSFGLFIGMAGVIRVKILELAQISWLNCSSIQDFCFMSELYAIRLIFSHLSSAHFSFVPDSYFRPYSSLYLFLLYHLLLSFDLQTSPVFPCLVQSIQNCN